MSPIIVWSIFCAIVVGLAYYATRVAKLNGEESDNDLGLAILEFGKAFPGEAIRSLRATADGKAIFVRLHDGKAGIMKAHKHHNACHLIEPGRVRITPRSDSKGFAAEFFDAPTQSGTFVFKNEQEAAEVSLWLLDNYLTAESAEKPAGTGGAPASAH
ncbi:MAG: hypothetical protein PW791_11285 [Neorhizobium sp.]|nr:hypothetical protein [Neorhizobium sp.]